ncbi:MAG TPA: carboxypeptidase-like regulatory domain-containing protein, partial [Bacteroidia bacterium]|nr:carboxypeptidase-like regulatory domain-containing protein [Bacteroidia bacterium]
MQFFSSIDSYGNVFISKERPIETTLPNSFFEKQEQQKEVEESNNSKKENGTYLKYQNTLPAKNIYIGNKKDGAYKEEVIMSGYVSNKNNNTKAIGAMLYFEELKTGTTTDANGFYTIKLKKGNYSLKIRGTESEEDKYNVHVYSDGNANFYLREKINTLNEVVITADANNNVER